MFQAIRSIKRSDDQIRIDSQLIDAQAAEHLVKPGRKSRAADGGIERKEAVGEASHLNINNNHYQARALRVLGPLLAVGAPTVGRGKTF